MQYIEKERKYKLNLINSKSAGPAFYFEISVVRVKMSELLNKTKTADVIFANIAMFVH